jgi:hypothetical protein
MLQIRQSRRSVEMFEISSEIILTRAAPAREAGGIVEAPWGGTPPPPHAGQGVAIADSYISTAQIHIPPKPYTLTGCAILTHYHRRRLHAYIAPSDRPGPFCLTTHHAVGCLDGSASGAGLGTGLSFKRMGACHRTPGKAVQGTNLGPSVSRTVLLCTPLNRSGRRPGASGTWLTAFSTARRCLGARRAVEPLYRALNPSPACIWREHPYWSGQTRLGPSYRRVCEGDAASASIECRRSPAPSPPMSRIPDQPLARAPFTCCRSGPAAGRPFNPR